MLVTFETSQESRGQLKEGGAGEHEGHVGHFRDVPAVEGLVKIKGSVEHGGHVGHFRDVPRIKGPVEGGGAGEHPVHVGHGRDIPAGEVAVKDGGTEEHGGHVGHFRDVPAVEGLVEGVGVVEHGGHVSHFRDVPAVEGLVKIRRRRRTWSSCRSLSRRSSREMSPLKEEASRNMFCIEVTRDKSGASAALYSMPEAPLNAPLMEDHSMSPHWSMDASLDAVEPVAARFILEGHRSSIPGIRQRPGTCVTACRLW